MTEEEMEEELRQARADLQRAQIEKIIEDLTTCGSVLGLWLGLSSGKLDQANSQFILTII